MNPPGPPARTFWDDREDSPEDQRRGFDNRLRALTDLITHALGGEPLDAARVAQWHTTCFTGMSYVSKADECLLGAYRGSSHPRLKRMPVEIGGKPGTAASAVADELDRFFEALNRGVNDLARGIDPQRDKGPAELRRIAALAAWAHGEWVRIHPFANGSGRTARLIANWVLVRFGLLPVVGVRPRPQHPYAPAAAASMNGDHVPMTDFIVDLLETQSEAD